nr:heme ABC transporter ATP-binding protein [Deinobacterium chartae]
MVGVHDLSYTVSGRRLLDAIELELRAGELLVIVGCNGAGKSTLLKHISGELGRREGIALFGQDLRRWNPGELARKRAVLPQSTALSFAYEVLEVVLLGRIPHQRRQTETREDREIALRCLERVGLAAYAGRNYLTLSGGEQQRVHLARVLAQLEGTPGERLLMLDEPTSSLDLAHQHQVLRIARSLCQEGVGVLAVLHDLNLASQYADKVLVLGGGKVLAHGTPFEVLTPTILEEAFGHPVLVTRHPCLACPLVVSAT